jgi:hypothetical protein
MSNAQSNAAVAVRGLFSTLMLIAGILILVFGIFLAFEAQSLTWPSIVDFLVGAVLIVVSSWI